ncbi:hypothetical protein LI003_23985, partial [Bacteroides caccae]|uniref:hypothetical protein n=1 Tax=Bacteroides caccae TaxID=47678 RepID=UPI001D08B7AC
IGLTRLARRLFGEDKRPRLVAPFARNVEAALKFAAVANQLLRGVENLASDEAGRVVANIAETCIRVLGHLV